MFMWTVFRIPKLDTICRVMYQGCGELSCIHCEKRGEDFSPEDLLFSQRDELHGCYSGSYRSILEMCVHIRQSTRSCSARKKELEERVAKNGLVVLVQCGTR